MNQQKQAFKLIQAMVDASAAYTREQAKQAVKRATKAAEKLAKAKA